MDELPDCENCGKQVSEVFWTISQVDREELIICSKKCADELFEKMCNKKPKWKKPTKE